MRFSTVWLLTGALLACGAVAPFAQDVAGVAEADVTTQSGSRGVMVRPLGPGPYPAVLHLHGSGDTVASNVEILRLFARAGYVAMDIELGESWISFARTCAEGRGHGELVAEGGGASRARSARGDVAHQ